MKYSSTATAVIVISLFALFAGLLGCSDNTGDRKPNIVPFLDNIPSDIDGHGSAVLESSVPVQAGSLHTFKIIYTAGKPGVIPGGFVMLQISPWWGWSKPQTSFPEVPGYTVVDTSFNDPSLEVYTLPLNRVVVYSRERSFQHGEQLTFSYSAEVDRFAEREELFQVFIDADGDGHYAGITNPPSLSITARAPSRLNVTVPSQSVPGKPVKLQISPLDAMGNWSELPAGEYTLNIMRDGQSSGSVVKSADGGEKTITFQHVPEAEGIYFFSVKGPYKLQGQSNVMLCEKRVPELKLLFGDIHGHSRMSDGTGTPEDYYRYARDVSGLDIAALTDHADHGTLPFKGRVWDRIKKAGNNAYEPGRFVTFLGYEWTNWEYGHRNVYYRDEAGPVFRYIDDISDTPEELWELLVTHEAMTIAHHVGGGPVATDWDVKPGPKEWLVEISSIHGTSEYFGGEWGIYRPVKGSFVRDALSRGYRLGIIASGDTHDGHPGQRSINARSGGIVGVYSASLTREAVWEAFKQKQVYGTSGPKIILSFHAANSPMGSEVKWKASSGPVPLTVRVIGCDDVSSVEIIRNSEKIIDEKAEGVFVHYFLQDNQTKIGTSWYYARIIQKDGNIAWSSPVWVTVE